MYLRMRLGTDWGIMRLAGFFNKKLVREKMPKE